MQHDGEAGQLTDDFLQDVKAQLGLGAGLELVSAVAGTDGDGQGIAAGLGHELLHLLGTGIVGVFSGDVHFVLYAGQRAQLGLYHHAMVMGVLHHLAGDLNVLRKRLGGSVDHYGGETAVDAGLAGFKAVAVIQVQRDGDLGALNDGSLHQLHQIGVVGVSPGALGHLQDDGSLLLPAGLSDGLDDLHVVDVESADGVTAVISLLEHLGSSNESHWNQSFLNTAATPLFYPFIIPHFSGISIIIFAISRRAWYNPYAWGNFPRQFCNIFIWRYPICLKKPSSAP